MCLGDQLIITCANRRSLIKAFKASASKSGSPSTSFTFKLSKNAEDALRPIVTPTPLSITVCLSNPNPFLLLITLWWFPNKLRA
ncbi:hypothetical protein Hanom_Chr03g00246201 [Helianthus anomalus]